MADIKTSDFPLLGSLKLTDRVVLTSADTRQEIAAMTVEKFLDECSYLKPTSWYSSTFNVPLNAVYPIDTMMGLLVIQIISIDGTPGVYMVNSFHQTITHIAGRDYTDLGMATLGVAADRKVTVTNNSPYELLISVSYQNMGRMIP